MRTRITEKWNFFFPGLWLYFSKWDSSISFFKYNNKNIAFSLILPNKCWINTLSTWFWRGTKLLVCLEYFVPQSFPGREMEWGRNHRGGDLWLPLQMKFGRWEGRKRNATSSPHTRVSDFFYLLFSLSGMDLPASAHFTTVLVRHNYLVCIHFLETFPNWQTHYDSCQDISWHIILT